MTERHPAPVAACPVAEPGGIKAAGRGRGGGRALFLPPEVPGRGPTGLGKAE